MKRKKVAAGVIVIVAIILVIAIFQQTSEKTWRVELLPGQNITIGDTKIHLFNVVLDKEWCEENYRVDLSFLNFDENNVTKAISFCDGCYIQFRHGKNLIVLTVYDKKKHAHVYVMEIGQEAKIPSENVTVKFSEIKPRIEEINGVYYPKIPAAILEFRFN